MTDTPSKETGQPKAIETKCPECGSTKTFVISSEEFRRLEAGEYIQDILRGLSADDRERLITGICPTCWEVIFSGCDD